MGLQKVAFNFIVERGGKLAKSLLCTKPQKAVTNIKGIKYNPIVTDTVHFAQNDYLANIQKLGLNEKDSKILEDLLSDSEHYTRLERKCLTDLRQKFNQVINRSDIDLNELRTLFTGEEVNFGFGLFAKKRWHNKILKNPLKRSIVLDKLKSMNPKDLEILKKCNDDAINSLYEYGDFMIPDKYIKKLSGLLKKDDIYISEVYSKDLDRRIVECYGKGDKTYFKYDPKNGDLVFFEEDGTAKLIKERIILNDAKGNPTQLLKYEKSDVDGVFNVAQINLRTGKETKLSEAFIDNTGKKIVRQNLVSPKGTKSQVHYEEMPNGNTQYNYSITDKNVRTLLEQVRTRTVLNDSEFIHKVNDKSYNVKFTGSDKIEILNQETKQLDTIDLKSLLSDLTDTEKTEMINMLKRVPADELLALNKNGIKQIWKGSISSSSTLFESGSISTIPNEFVFLHELGHQKDSVKSCLSRKEKELLREMHKESKNMWDNTKDWNPDLDKSLDAYEIINKLQKAAQKATISINKDLLKIYKKEKAAYIRKFGSDDSRIDYFINKGSGLGCEGEAVAEINALLSTPLSESMLGTRSYLLAENFPETIAYARKLLFD